MGQQTNDSRSRQRRHAFERLEPRRALAINLTGPSTVASSEGEWVELAPLRFSDSTPQTTYQATIDWGDGSAEEPLSVAGRSPSTPIRIRLDYRFDTLGFFEQPARRAALQQAADTLANWLTDDLAPIQPTAQNQFTAEIVHPGTGQPQQIPGLAVAAKELVIFVGGRDLAGETLASGATGTFQAIGTQDFLETVNQRGQRGAPITDLGIWGGHLSFDLDEETDWHFGITTNGLERHEFDFFTVALHEMMHLLGFSETQTAYARHVSAGEFGGPAAVKEYDVNAIPRLVPDDLSHWATGTKDDGRPTLMTATLDAGVRKTATPLDLAVLQDIGWQLAEMGPTGEFSLRHRYLDDGSYTVRILLTDRAESASLTIPVTVRNTPPQMEVTPPTETRTGEPMTLIASYFDAGTMDALTATVDWGDGNQSQLDLDGHQGQLRVVHTYAAPGQFDIQLRISDDDGDDRVQSTVASIRSSDWQNPSNVWDVNGDGIVSPLDALLIINEVNRPRFSAATGALEDAGISGVSWYFDVNGDNYVTAIDALGVINRLNHSVAVAASVTSGAGMTG